MIYIGIDPGKSGAFASVLQEGDATVYPWDEAWFLECMREFSELPCFAVLEHVSAMPGQGVTSMFSFGENFGFIQGVLKAYGIPYELVRPQKWKKEFSLTKDKNKSVEVCKRLFPGVELRASPRCRKDHDGMAEALLMAEYARRISGREKK